MNTRRARKFTIPARALALMRGYAAASQGKSVNVTTYGTVVAAAYHEPAVCAVTDRGSIGRAGSAAITDAVRGSLLLLALLGVAGCASEPERLVSVPQITPVPDTNVYFYPAQGHAAPTAQQQDRDKYECKAWAVEQTHFDPSAPSLPPQQRVLVVAGGPPPGTGVAVGAVTGAMIGAAVSNPWHAGGNTLLGALAGAAIGGIAEAERNEQANRIQAQANADANGNVFAVIDNQALEYRRAMSACLEGRGYSVR